MIQNLYIRWFIICSVISVCFFMFNNNDIKIISNFNAECTENNKLIIKSLKKQMANRVRWTESINTLAKLGINQIIEIGPGKVLSGLIKRISNSFDIKNITNISDLKNNE